MNLYPSPTPLRCAVLAVDPAERSGWAVWAEGKLLDHGTTTHPFERAAAVQRAFGVAAERGLPLVVVAETWSARRFQAKGGRMSTASIAGMGAAWGRWLEQIDTCHTPNRVGRWTGPAIVRVEPPTWRAQTIGNGGNSASMKLRAMQRACSIARQAGLPEPTWSDAADAVVIGEWACRAAEVERALPVSCRRAA